MTGFSPEYTGAADKPKFCSGEDYFADDGLDAETRAVCTRIQDDANLDEAARAERHAAHAAAKQRLAAKQATDAAEQQALDTATSMHPLAILARIITLPTAIAHWLFPHTLLMHSIGNVFSVIWAIFVGVFLFDMAFWLVTPWL